MNIEQSFWFSVVRTSVAPVRGAQWDLDQNSFELALDRREKAATGF
ncbi:MAG: hypothetical protein ACR2GP_06945 [Burkholderiaceae bacterium]